MKKLIQILNILAFGAMVYVNYLANTLPIGGKTTGEISDSYSNLFAPAGITFSIWGVIYLFLLGFTIYQARDLFQSNANNDSWFNRIGMLFVLTCLVNMGWLYLWHNEMILYSLGAMVVFLVLLIAIYTRLGIGRVGASSGVTWLVHVPFSIYLGWITVATIANATTYLVSTDWDGFGLAESQWAMIMIIIAAFIGQKVLSSRGDIAYGLVLIWAFTGIYLARKDDQQTVMIAALVGIALIILSMLPYLIRRFRRG